MIYLYLFACIFLYTLTFYAILKTILNTLMTSIIVQVVVGAQHVPLSQTSKNVEMIEKWKNAEGPEWKRRRKRARKDLSSYVTTSTKYFSVVRFLLQRDILPSRFLSRCYFFLHFFVDVFCVINIVRLTF